MVVSLIRSAACFAGGVLALVACAPDVEDTAPEEAEEPVLFPPNAAWAEDPLWDLAAPATFRVELPVEDWDTALWDIMPVGDACAPRPYLKGRVVFVDPTDGVEEIWDDVGVRWRGRSALKQDLNETRLGIKLSFDEFSSGRKFYGLQKINLMGTEGDHSQLREQFALRIARDLGIAAPRSSYVHLFVNDVYMGYYPMTEEADDTRYLRNHFGEDNGSLFKVKGYCGGRGSFEDLGDDPLLYTPYDPRAGTPDSAVEDDILPIIRCLRLRDDAEFTTCIEEHLDVENWLTEIAVDVVLPDIDGMIGTGQNYMMYKRADTGLFEIWPWDKDLALSEDNLDPWGDLTGFHPDWAPDFKNRLGDRLVHVYKQRYCDIVLEVAHRYDPARLVPEVRRHEALMRPWMASDPWTDMTRWVHRVDDVVRVIEGHHPFVEDQAYSCIFLNED